MEVYVVGLWLDMGKLVGWDCYVVPLDKLWGSNRTARRSTPMANATLICQGTAEMGNEDHVVDI